MRQPDEGVQVRADLEPAPDDTGRLDAPAPAKRDFIARVLAGDEAAFESLAGELRWLMSLAAPTRVPPSVREEFERMRKERAGC